MASSEEIINTYRTIRGRDIKLRYTQDDNEDGLINQRTFFDPNGDQLTPVTPLLLARETGTPNPALDRVGSKKARTATVCFGNPSNLSGESNFTVIIPYHPGDSVFADHLRELFNYTSLSAFLDPNTPQLITYHGENYE